ncbi:MAG: hypothetical protein ABI658_14925 [Acidimicrobiales bacterium]
MDDLAARLSSLFARAGLAVLLAFILAVSALTWLSWPDRTTTRFSSSESSTAGAGAISLFGVKEDSLIDRLRRLEAIPRPELTLLILVGVTLACAVPLVTHNSTVTYVGRMTCRLGQLLGALFAFAGVVAAIDVLRQQHGFDTLARPFSHLNAAALAAASAVLARFGAKPNETKRVRVKRPVPRPLGVPRNSRLS